MVETLQRTKAQISDIMRRIKSRDTRPEIVLRRALSKRGLKLKLYDKKLPGKPDVVIPSKRLAVFVDGDFWHGNQWKVREHPSLQSQFRGVQNKKYWLSKILRNRSRDFLRTSALLDSGWRVIRFWESDIRKNLDRCLSLTVKAARRRAPGGFSFSELSRRTTAEFFAGIGLVRQALQGRGWNVIYANDIDPEKLEMYQENFGAKDCHLEDVHNLSVDEVPSCALATASFPCNDLSVAGARNGLNGKQSGAFWGLIRILREMEDCRPPLVMLENVPGFLTSHEGKDFEAAMMALNDLGYACDTFVLNAANFTPQSRLRLFVIAKPAADSKEVQDLEISETRPKALVDFIKEHPNIMWDVRALPSPPKRHVRVDSILEDIPSGDPIWWSRDRGEYFMNQLSERHLKIAREMISRPTYSYATAFRRVRNGKSMAEIRVDGIAGCLRTPRGGSGRQILFKAGRGKYAVRLMTPRECARLQGVPEAYRINAPLNQALFGFGDAVCVPVVEWIADNYLTPVAAELLRGRLLVPVGGRS